MRINTFTNFAKVDLGKKGAKNGNYHFKAIEKVYVYLPDYRIGCFPGAYHDR
jgi:hypothetical protein